MTALHVYLNSEDSGNQFTQQHFAALRAKWPELELIVHSDQASLEASLDTIEWLDTWFFEASWYAKAANLKAIFTPAAGKNWISPSPKGDIPIYHGSFHGPMIAETMLGLMLHFNRDMPTMLRKQSERSWDRNAQKDNRLLSSQTALILGYGNIGKHCGKLLTGLGMKVYGHQRAHSEGVDPETGVIYIHQSQYESYLDQADHIVMLLPGNASTKHFITRQQLLKMKPSACLYNFGRGTTINETELVWALDNQEISAAGLDVTEIEPLPLDSPLWTHPKVMLLPHSSCVFQEYQALHVSELICQLDKLSNFCD